MKLNLDLSTQQVDDLLAEGREMRLEIERNIRGMNVPALTTFERFLLLTRDLQALQINRRFKESAVLAEQATAMWVELTQSQQNLYKQACTFHISVLPDMKSNDYY